MIGWVMVGCTWIGGSEYDQRLDPDRDGSPYPEDCAPEDPAVFPGADEVCGNRIDEDCVGGDLPCETDADADADADSDADVDTSDTGCAGPDADGDGVPDACDGCPDAPELAEPVLVPVDGDGDGFGVGNTTTCEPPSVVPRAGDCDDADPFVRPIAREVAGNAVDEDCDGALACFADADGDGLADIEAPVDGNGDGDCADPGESTSATDCDDASAGVGAGGCADQPPVAALAIGAYAVEAGGQVDLSGKWSTDAEDAPGTLEMRLDFDGDGVFDTAFGTATDAVATYGSAGLYTVVLEVRDSAGQVSWATGRVAVAAPGALLVVDTDADDNDPEVAGGPYTSGLSLREALSLASGAETISFADRFLLAPASALPSTSADGLTILGVPGLVLDGAAAGGIGLELRGDDVTVADLNLRGWGTALTFGGAGARSIGCELEGNTDSYDLQVDGVEIVEGWVHDNAAEQIRVGRRATIERTRVSGGTTGILIEGDAHATEIRGCVIADVAGDGIVLENAGGGADGVVLTDGTIVGNADGVDVAVNSDGLVLQNTIVASNTGAGVRGGDFAAGSPGTVMWWDNAGGDCSGCGTGSAAVLADPLFVAPAQGDYRLRRASPAVDVGASTGFDRNGAAPGTSAGAPDIGAHER